MPKFIYYYIKALRMTVKWIALMIVIASALEFILILCDQLLGLHWGYPWWSALYALGITAISLAVWRAAKKSLKHLQRQAEDK